MTTWTTADWAFLISIATAIGAVVGGFATWRYAHDTRRQVNASLYPHIEIGLAATVDALKPSVDHEAYFMVTLNNVHATVDALNVSYSIWTAVRNPDPRVRPKWPASKNEYSVLQWKRYHEEEVGMLRASTARTYEAQLGNNRYREDGAGREPIGEGFDTFLRDYLPEYRRVQVTGKEKNPTIVVRVDLSYKPGSFGAPQVHKQRYYLVLPQVSDQGKVWNLYILDPGDK